MNIRNSLTNNDLTELITAYAGKRIEVRDFKMESVKGGFGINSGVYKIYDIDTGSSFNLELNIFLKQYLVEDDMAKKYPGSKIAFRIAKLDELSEKPFYRYANNIIWKTDADEKKRIAPFSLDAALSINNHTFQKFRKYHRIALEGYTDGDLRDILKRRIDEKKSTGGKINWSDIKNWVLDPLLLLWVKATDDCLSISAYMPNPKKVGRAEHENKIYAPSSETLTKRHVNYYSKILKDKLGEAPEKILNSIEKYYQYFAPYVSAEKFKDLRAIIHGDCYWRNHLGRVLIDFTNFRFSSWLVDVASLLKNPYITEDLKLKFDDKEIVETCIEKIINVQEELGTKKRVTPKKSLTNLALHSLYSSSLYFKSRNWGFNVMYNEVSPGQYNEFLKKETMNDVYNRISLESTKGDFINIINNNYSSKGCRAAEAGLKVHEKLKKLGLFNES